MKSLVASTVTIAVLTSGVVPAAVSQFAFPPWFCKVFPMLCNRA